MDGMVSDLYFIAPDLLVFIYSRSDDGTWNCSRMPSTCKQKFALVFGLKEHTDSWVVQDKSPGKNDEIMGYPDKTIQVQDPNQPPLGPWVIWGGRFTVTDRRPEHAPIETPLEVEVPCAKVVYSEEGTIGRLEVVLHSVAIADEDLEQLLNGVRRVIVNLARRPPMVLFIRSDGRQALVPALRHIRRVLSFIGENGTELVLVGRGHAIVLNPGILGSVLVNLVRWVQRLLPSPWKEVIVPSMEAGDAFLAEMAATEVRQFSSATPSDSRSQAAAWVVLPPDQEPVQAAVSSSASPEERPLSSESFSSNAASSPSMLGSTRQAGADAHDSSHSSSGLPPPCSGAAAAAAASQGSSSSNLPIGIVEAEADTAVETDFIDTGAYQASRSSWLCTCDPCQSRWSPSEPRTHVLIAPRT